MSQKTPKKKPAVTVELLDPATRARRRVLAKMKRMSPAELFALAVRAGIYTEQGDLTPPYRDDTAPSACRPTD